MQSSLLALIPRPVLIAVIVCLCALSGGWIGAARSDERHTVEIQQHDVRITRLEDGARNAVSKDDLREAQRALEARIAELRQDVRMARGLH